MDLIGAPAKRKARSLRRYLPNHIVSPTDYMIM